MVTESILIVDAEREIADLLEVYLKNENYDVHKFYNSLDALNYITKEPVSLAILDVMMPEMDGFTLCQKIRQKYLFPTPELISKYTGIARGKAERLEELINEFFEITRFSTNKLVLEPKATNISRMLIQITYEFNPVLRGKNLQWDLQIPESIEIVCDADKLERAVDNLIRNAINYSFSDSVIQFTLVSMPGSVQICVQNRGNTIPPEKLERIFEQFYRLDSARSSDTGGAGLGLAIAKEIIELHHGIITAYSADELIRFTIQLPLDCQKTV